ncbi:MAG: Sir2 family NAD-dependent protein deacetylase [Candidatus Komeilibacteria bacterium]|nr:Sir2 family NAD-dependent protein deacetylase [Candidatus Komeilibacteria bacterium]
MNPEQPIKPEAEKSNKLLTAPEIILPEDIEKMDKSWDATFFSDSHGYTLRYKNGQMSFTIEYPDRLPDDLTETEKSKFSVNDKIVDGKNVPVFTYQYGSFKEPEQKESNVGFAPEYHVAEPRDFETDMPEVQQMTVEDLTEFISNKKVIFYTGAGISAEAGVYNMAQLKEALGIDQAVPVDGFVRTVLNDPETAQNQFRQFCQSAFEHEPSPAHQSLAEIAKLKSTKILTENFDLLQERTGIKPYHTEGASLKKDIDPKWFSDIDAIVCVGLSFDDRGLLSWYKANNPSGKIISLDLSQPTYLGKEDALVKGDLQKILPEVEKQIKIQMGIN